MTLQKSDAVYLLDTDTVTAFAYGNVRIAAKLKEIPEEQVSISIVTVAEVLQGWLAEINRNQGKVKGDICTAYDYLANAQDVLRNFEIARYGRQAEAVYQEFPSSVKRIGANDCRIAATAISSGFIVVTRNTRHFAKIPNVKFEDWTTL